MDSNLIHPVPLSYGITLAFAMSSGVIYASGPLTLKASLGGLLTGFVFTVIALIVVAMDGDEDEDRQTPLKTDGEP